MEKSSNESLVQYIEQLKEMVDADELTFLSATINLSDKDYALMGKLIQLYCFADLNARRIIDCLSYASEGEEAQRASLLQDAQVFPRLREKVNEFIPDSDLKEGILKAVDTIELHRIHRHNFAHWAARKFPDQNALILFTKNSKEAERRDGIAQRPRELKYAIVPLEGLQGEVVKLEGHTDYLAHRAAHIEANLESFRATISAVPREKL